MHCCGNYTQAAKQIRALAFAVNIYRNSIIEDIHACDQYMPEGFLDTLKKHMKTEYDIFWMRYEKYLNRESIFINHDETSKELKNDLYFEDFILFTISLLKEWDSPKKIKEKYNGDIFDYIINGAVKRAYNEKTILSDPVMANLNRDVYNRAYTLVLMGVL